MWLKWLTALSAAVVVVLAPAVAQAAEPHPRLVSTNPVDATPQVVASDAVPWPHVNAIGRIGSTVIAGGLFDTVQLGTAPALSRGNVMAFDARSGAISTFAPRLAGGQVWAIATDPATNSVYVGGKFTTVDGVARAALAKLNATTGAVDPNFRPAFTGGQVNDLELATVAGSKRLIVGGTMGKKLFSLNPATGADDRFFASVISDAIPNAWGGVAVYQFALNSAGSKLVATGNFQKVDGQPRTRLFLMDLAGTRATLNSWYYPGFAKPCASTSSRRIAYLQGVDWSPDGSAFSVAATGQIPANTADIWYQRLGDRNNPNTTVCDAVGRFRLSDPTKPVWINYTGGDSIWAVADTGAAVYVAGHFKFLDNPDGYASLDVGDKAGQTPASSRRGIGAVDPSTGLAAAWAPNLTSTKIGGKAFLATSTGLWVGNDATAFRGEPHRGLAFAPLL